MSSKRTSFTITRSVKDAREKVKEDPNSAENQMYLGEMLYIAGQYREAEAPLRLALELLEKEPTKTIDLPKSYHPKLVEMIQEGQKKFQVKMTGTINILLADILLNLNRYSESLEFYEKAIKFDPNFPGMWQNYGVALTSAGKTKKALRPYREAIRRAPHDKTQWRNIGAAYQELGRIAELNICLRVLKQNRRLEFDLLDLSELYLYSNDYEKCELVLNELLRKDRNDGYALVTKARLKIAQHKSSEALALSDQVLEVAKNHAGALWFKARAFLIEGDFKKAKELVEQVLTSEPEYANAQITLDELKRMEEKGESSASTNYRIIIKSKGQSRMEQGDPIGVCPTVRDAFPVVRRFYLAHSGIGPEHEEEIELGEFSYSISHPVDETNFGMVNPVIPEQVIRDGDVLWVEVAQLNPYQREQIRLMSRVSFSGKL